MANSRLRVTAIRHSIAAASGVTYYFWNTTFLERKKDVMEAGGFIRYLFGNNKHQGSIMYVEHLIRFVSKANFTEWI